MGTIETHQTTDGRTYPVVRRAAESDRTTGCPFCGKAHQHGEGDGHRVAHCGDEAPPVIRVGNQELRRADGYWLKTGAA